jgi:hypothetical protein
MHQRSSWHHLRWLHSVNPPQVIGKKLGPETPSKIDPNQLARRISVAIRHSRPACCGVPNNPRCSNSISPQRHPNLILINAADDRVKYSADRSSESRWRTAMRTLDIIRGIFAKGIALMSRPRRSDFTCGDCERWQRCGLPPHDDCIVRAEQLARGAMPVKRLHLPVY